MVEIDLDKSTHNNKMFQGREESAWNQVKPSQRWEFETRLNARKEQ